MMDVRFYNRPLDTAHSRLSKLVAEFEQFPSAVVILRGFSPKGLARIGAIAAEKF